MRSDLQVVADLVNENARVLDLGCGSGELLAYLKASKNIRGYGVENDHGEIAECIRHGVNVIEHDLNLGLDRFADNSFDMVVMTETLQAVESPQNLLRELLRIGMECIVTFPNFAYWQCRLQMALKGRMPVSKHLPFDWFNTPNIHLCTYVDFYDLCVVENLRVIDRFVVDSNYHRSGVINRFPNILGSTAFYRLGRSP